MIHIVDYGVGNVASIKNMISKCGGESVLSKDPEQLLAARKIIIPGVGAFDHGIDLLSAGGWIEALNHKALVEKIPVLGICLGMQLMCKRSEEGSLPGLGWIDGEVKRFQLLRESKLKVPHMGWNVIDLKADCPLFSNEYQRFYFVHSYHVICKNSEDVRVTASHGYEFTAGFMHGNIAGVQFHPEKSHKFGMKFIKKFMDWVC